MLGVFEALEPGGFSGVLSHSTTRQGQTEVDAKVGLSGSDWDLGDSRHGLMRQMSKTLLWSSPPSVHVTRS